MLELTLNEQMHEFVKRLRVVREDQIYTFFRDCGESNVSYELKKLRHQCKIYAHQDNKFSVSKDIRADLHDYDTLLDAIDVMCYFTSREIRWFAVTDYPLELRFLTTDDCLYDVAVFTELNWVGKYSLIPTVRTAFLPNGTDDPYNHLAVSRSIDLLLRLKPLGFTQFALIDRNGHIDYYDP